MFTSVNGSQVTFKWMGEVTGSFLLDISLPRDDEGYFDKKIVHCNDMGVQGKIVAIVSCKQNEHPGPQNDEDFDLYWRERAELWGMIYDINQIGQDNNCLSLVHVQQLTDADNQQPIFDWDDEDKSLDFGDTVVSGSGAVFAILTHVNNEAAEFREGGNGITIYEVICNDDGSHSF